MAGSKVGGCSSEDRAAGADRGKRAQITQAAGLQGCFPFLSTGAVSTQGNPILRVKRDRSDLLTSFMGLSMSITLSLQPLLNTKYY